MSLAIVLNRLPGQDLIEHYVYFYNVQNDMKRAAHILALFYPFLVTLRLLGFRFLCESRAM
jgi:hypothetical protein